MALTPGPGQTQPTKAMMEAQEKLIQDKEDLLEIAKSKNKKEKESLEALQVEVHTLYKAALEKWARLDVGDEMKAPLEEYKKLLEARLRVIKGIRCSGISEAENEIVEKIRGGVINRLPEVFDKYIDNDSFEGKKSAA